MPTAQHQNEPYEYKALPSGSRHDYIRVLRLLPGRELDPIEFQLIQTSIKECAAHLAYEAVSYVWGDVTIKIPVICQDDYEVPRHLEIGQNLHAALLRFRSADQDRLLWADACCINQSDVAEVSQQVAMMRSIYASAKGVLVWLGPDEQGISVDAAKLVVDLFLALKKAHEDNDHERGNDELNRYRWGRAERNFVPGIRGFPDVSLDLTLYQGGDLADLPKLLDKELRSEIKFLLYSGKDTWNTTTAWSAFEKYLAVPWFTRLWVLQEVQSNSSVTLYHGSTSLPLLCVLTAVACQMNWWADVQKPEVDGRISRYVPRANMVLKPMEKRNFNALQLLSLTNAMDSTNHHDRIYAMLGLPGFAPFVEKNTTNEGLLFKVDYSKSAAEVYTNWALATIKAYQDLRTLSFIGTESSQSLLPNKQSVALPSWVPDWTRRLHGGLGMTYELWSATKTNIEEVQIDESNRALMAEGSTVGVIKATHQVLDAEGQPDEEVLKRLLFSQNKAWDNMEILDQEQMEWLIPLACSLTAGQTWKRTRASDDSVDTLYNFMAFARLYFESMSDISIRGEGAAYRRTVMEDMRSSVVFELQDGTLGSCERKAIAGDKVCVILGSKVPLVLRQAESTAYQLVCSAYVHGWMQGRADRDWDSGQLSQESLVIV